MSIRSARCGKRSFTNGMKRRAAAGFKTANATIRRTRSRDAPRESRSRLPRDVGEARYHRHHEDVASDSARASSNNARSRNPGAAPEARGCVAAFDRAVIKREVHRQLRARLILRSSRGRERSARLGRDRQISPWSCAKISSIERVSPYFRSAADKDRSPCRLRSRRCRSACARGCATDLGRHPLDENLALEVHRVAQLEKVVRVARVAIHASELTSAVRVDSPSKRHARTSQRLRIFRTGISINSTPRVASRSSAAGNRGVVWRRCSSDGMAIFAFSSL